MSLAVLCVILVILIVILGYWTLTTLVPQFRTDIVKIKVHRLDNPLSEDKPWHAYGVIYSRPWPSRGHAISAHGADPDKVVAAWKANARKFVRKLPKQILVSVDDVK